MKLIYNYFSILPFPINTIDFTSGVLQILMGACLFCHVVLLLPHIVDNCYWFFFHAKPLFVEPAALGIHMKILTIFFPDSHE